MAEAWEQLAAEYNGKSKILIGEIDCTDPNSKKLCQQFKVDSYPTLMYGDIIQLQEYKGSRELDDLRTVVQDYLPYQLCSVAYPHLCDIQKRQAIEDLLHMGRSKLEKEIERVEETQQMLDKKQDAIVAKLKKKYDNRVAKMNQDKQSLEKELTQLRAYLKLKKENEQEEE
jgi:Thioredoxin